MEKFKTKPLFFSICVIAFFLLIISSYFIRNISPSIDIVASIALIVSVAFPLWSRFFPTAPMREYHVSPQQLTRNAYWQDKAELEVHIENTGDTDINLKFLWLETTSNIRFNFRTLQNSLHEKINSSITIKPHHQEDVFVTFETADANWNRVSKNVTDALNHKDLRLVEEIKDIQARLVWSDTTARTQEKMVPFGFWLYEHVRNEIPMPPKVRVVDI